MINPLFSHWGPHHELTIPGALQRGTFLSTVGHLVDLEVEQLWCINQDWGNFPNEVGYLFPNLKQLSAISLKIKSFQRINFKNMGKLT